MSTRSDVVGDGGGWGCTKVAGLLGVEGEMPEGRRKGGRGKI